jgi:hypothetical protein
MKTSVIMIFLIVIFILFSVSDCTYNNDEVCTPRYKDTVVTKRNPCDVVPDGLIACYAFNGNANDGSGYGNNGTIHGAVFTKDRYGVDSSALYFDGIDDYVIVPDDSILRVKNSITLAAWFKTKDPNINTDGQAAVIVAKHQTHFSRSYGIYVSDTTTKLDYVGFELFEPNDNEHYFNFNSFYWDDNWHFFVATNDYESGFVRIFIDGLLVLDYFGGSINIMINDIPLTIGCYIDGYDLNKQRGFFHGIIDDVQIYNRAITYQEILKIFRN